MGTYAPSTHFRRTRARIVAQSIIHALAAGISRSEASHEAEPLAAANTPAALREVLLDRGGGEEEVRKTIAAAERDHEPYTDIQVTCRRCREIPTVRLRPTDYLRWRGLGITNTGQCTQVGTGCYVQQAFPYLTADERELLVSGVCGPCYDAMFPEEPR